MKKFLVLALCFLAAVSAFSQRTPHKKPVIGISVGRSMNNEYTRAIEMAGGIPIILAETTDTMQVSQTFDLLDGLIMSGGDDVHPKFYGDTISAFCGAIDEDRDNFEFLLMREAMKRKMPMLATCRGLQILNVLMGGTLYQDLPTEHPSEVNHCQNKGLVLEAHDVDILPDTELYKIVGKNRMPVTSRHHQAVKDLAPGLRVAAWSPDSIVEAAEIPELSVIAVQWHPETNVVNGEPEALKFYKKFISRALRYGLTRRSRPQPQSKPQPRK